PATAGPPPRPPRPRPGGDPPRGAHSSRPLPGTARAGAQGPEELVGVDPGVVPVLPGEVDCVVPHLLDIRHLGLPGPEDRPLHHSERQPPLLLLLGLLLPLIVAQRAGTLLSQQVEGVNALVIIPPANGHHPLLSVHRDLPRGRAVRRAHP